MTRPAAVSFGEALKFWLQLGFISFGGPAGQIAIMHKVLVEQRRWISERRFLHALNYCMLLPGPEAQQLATYIGWLMHRTWGGIVAGALFVLPSLFILIGLSWIYIVFGTLPLALTTGAGAAAQNAIGTAVTGGLLSATFIDLLFIPFFFVLISRLFGKKSKEPVAPPSVVVHVSEKY